MFSKLETLPNEILQDILSYFSWDDLLILFWSLNIRLNRIICSILSNSGLIISYGLSYIKFSTVLPLLLCSSSLRYSIQHIHIDGKNSNAYDICYKWLFNDESISHFPNLKSLSFTHCHSMKTIVKILSSTIQNQLENLTITFRYPQVPDSLNMKEFQLLYADIKTQMEMFAQLICKIFSGQCRLASLRLGTASDSRHDGIYDCLRSISNLPSNEYDSYSLTLRRLHIQLNAASFLINVVDRVPNIEQLSIEFADSLSFCSFPKLDNQSDENWFKKVPKLRDFTLKASMHNDNDFLYVKWILNNINFIKNLKIYLKSRKLYRENLRNLWKLPLDANFIHQHCLPDSTLTLISFRFYMCFERRLSFDEIEKIRNSFQIHSFFVNRQWTNVTCLFDSVKSYQHLFASFNTNTNLNHSNYASIFNWATSSFCESRLYPTSHLLLNKFHHLHLHVSCINITRDPSDDFEMADLEMSLEILSRIKQNVRSNNPFRNVTKIQFGISFKQDYASFTSSRNRNELREKVLAHLISMTTQLRCLRIEQFHWLFHTIQNQSDEQLCIDALRTIQYLEFNLSEARYEDKDIVNVGQHLVPFLSTCMPRLQTIRICRPSDFLWTSILPDSANHHAYTVAHRRYLRLLRTPQSIAQHVTEFQQVLSQLVKNLQKLIYLEIYGDIYADKVEPYCRMTQALFPQCKIDVQQTHFRLWL